MITVRQMPLHGLGDVPVKRTVSSVISVDLDLRAVRRVESMGHTSSGSAIMKRRRPCVVKVRFAVLSSTHAASGELLLLSVSGPASRH